MLRRSSLLPDPVAPTMMPWGPIPDDAASLRSSSTAFPASSRPTGTLSSCRICRPSPPATSVTDNCRLVLVTSEGPSAPSSSHRRTLSAKVDEDVSQPRRRGARRRAILRAISGLNWSGCTCGSTRPPGPPSM